MILKKSQPLSPGMILDLTPLPTPQQVGIDNVHINQE